MPMKTCPVTAENIKDKLLLEKMTFFELSTYISQVKGIKAKTLTSNSFRIFRTKNYSNRFIFVIRKIIGWRF